MPILGSGNENPYSSPTSRVSAPSPVKAKTAPKKTSTPKVKGGSSGSSSGSRSSGGSSTSYTPSRRVDTGAVERRLDKTDKADKNKVGTPRIKEQTDTSRKGNTELGKRPAVPAGGSQLDFESWLAKDSTYQDALNSYNRSMAEATSTKDYLTNVANTDQANQLADWDVQYNRGLDSLLEDFAARGMANSGAYAQERSNYMSDQESARQALMDAIARRIEEVNTGYESTQTGLNDTLALARREAADRGRDQKLYV